MLRQQHPSRLPCGSRLLDFSRPQVMGILNVTPDSFSDGGRFTARDAALRHAEQMVVAGATLIDIGGESTRRAREAFRRQRNWSALRRWSRLSPASWM